MSMNEKKLILGLLRPIDLIIFINGIVITTILIIIFASLDNLNTFMTIIALLPVIICTILIMPLKKHHNVLVAIKHLLKK